MRAMRAAVCATLLGGCDAPPELPPVPQAEGPLHLSVVFPAAGAVLPPSGSYNVYGSVGDGRAALTVNGRPVRVLPNGSFLAHLPVPDPRSPRYELVATVGGDTARAVLPVRLAPAGEDAPPGGPSLPVAVGSPASLGSGAGADPVVPASPAPGGDPRWLLLPGTRVRVTGTRGDHARVRLDSGQEAWVRAAALSPAEPGPERSLRVSAPRVTPSADWVDVRLPAAGRPPFLVEEDGGGFLLTLYGAEPAPDAPPGFRHLADPLVTGVELRRERGDRLRVRVSTARPPFGYAVRWEGGDLVLRVRRPPRVDPERPLRGLTVAVDPGHPPLGATGPTGLREADVTLAVGLRLKRMLEERGATVALTRSDGSAVGLDERARAAVRAGAHALVSLHVDASPGEVDPYSDTGTRSFFFHPHSAPLASAVQKAMLRRMGLNDRGLFVRDLAIVRTTWMPSVLCEGAMLTIPEHEAALRTPRFQAAYARGVTDGLEAYFRALR